MKRFVEMLLAEANIDKTWETNDIGKKVHERMQSDPDVATHMIDSPHFSAAEVSDHHSHRNPARREQISKKVMDHRSAEVDPTGPARKYLPWIASRYSSGGIGRFEDMDRVGSALQKFHTGKIRKQHAAAGTNPDINSYKTLSDLEDAVDKLPKEEKSGKEEKREIKSTGATKEVADHWKIIEPQTHEAAMLYSSNTRWCTSNKGTWEGYHRQGPMTILVPHKPNHEGEKYQIHPETNQFMDEKDRAADINNVFKDRPAPTLFAHRDQEIVSSHLKPSRSAWDGPSLAKVATVRAIHSPEMRDKLMGSSSLDVQRAIIAHGSDEQREKIMSRSDTLHPSIQSALVQTGEAKHIERYIKSPHLEVQKAIMLQGKQWSEKLIDNNKDLHKDVAIPMIQKHGSDMVGRFIGNKDRDVQEAMLRHGTPEQAKRIASDPMSLHETLQKTILETKAHPEAPDWYLKSPNSIIRALVARHGEAHHRRALKDDPTFVVKQTVQAEMKKRGES